MNFDIGLFFTNIKNSINYLSFEEIKIVTLALFSIIDIIGGIPLIVSLKEKAGGNIESGKATMVALVMLILFLFVGKEILGLFDLDVSTFAVAGSFVLFILALEMILGREIHKYDSPKTISIVPIAFPLIAGAGSLTIVLALSSSYHDINIIVGIIINMIIVYLVLRFSNIITKYLGPGLINILQRMFGIIVLAIAIKLFTTNLSTLIENM